MREETWLFGEIVKIGNPQTHMENRDWKNFHVQTGFFSRNPVVVLLPVALAPCYCTHFESSESPAPVDPVACQKVQ